jgi:alpha-D-ribose 1-methylphosphonate 5-triphosphate synthase subunit PhnI
MSDFTSELRQRAAEAQRSLAEARETGDDYLLQLSLGQIESLARLAVDNQVSLDGIEESLAAHGLATPGAGLPRLR